MNHHTVQGEAFSLSSSKPNDLVKVVQIRGGRTLRQRLLNLGIVPGVHMICIRGGGGYPMVLEVQHSRVVLGAGMSAHVLVTEAHE